VARTRKPQVLLIDDGTQYAELLQRHMPEVKLVAPRTTGLPRAADGKAALRHLEGAADRIDLVLLDMHFDVPDGRLLSFDPPKSPRRTRRFQGLRILQAIRERWPTLPVLLLTSQQDLSVIDGGEAVGAQSMTYYLDGDDLDVLRIRIHAALYDGQQPIDEDGVFWGDDATSAALRKRMAMLARGRLPVMIEGETGTGKSFLAERFVHRNSGRTGPFVVLDLSTVPTDLVSAHLFGAVRGAYTGAVHERKGVFEAAHGGTLFIDEIQNVPLELQKQLLLVLQEGKLRRLGSTADVAVDVKVIAASNESLQDAVRQGRFRSDLYMRLSPSTRLRIPPLRERRDDLRKLAAAFVQQAGDDRDLSDMRQALCSALGIDASLPLQLVTGGRAVHADATGLQLNLPRPAWQRLEKHAWPGNLRELSMVMHNLVSFTLVQALDALKSGAPLKSKRLQVDPLLVPDLLQAVSELGTSDGAQTASTAQTGLDDDAVAVHVQTGKTLNAVAQGVERQYLTALFERYGGDLSRMAETLLGDDSRTRAIRLRLNQLGVKVRDLRTR